MKETIPRTSPLAHERNSIFKCKQHTLHDPWGPEKYNYTMMKYGATLYSRHTGRQKKGKQQPRLPAKELSSKILDLMNSSSFAMCSADCWPFYQSWNVWKNTVRLLRSIFWRICQGTARSKRLANNSRYIRICEKLKSSLTLLEIQFLLSTCSVFERFLKMFQKPLIHIIFSEYIDLKTFLLRLGKTEQERKIVPLMYTIVRCVWTSATWNVVVCHQKHSPNWIQGRWKCSFGHEKV